MEVSGEDAVLVTGDLLYEAWTVIANAHEGDWDSAQPEWKAAAERWRDRWHGHLGERCPANADGRCRPDYQNGVCSDCGAPAGRRHFGRTSAE